MPRGAWRRGPSVSVAVYESRDVVRRSPAIASLRSPLEGEDYDAESKLETTFFNSWQVFAKQVPYLLVPPPAHFSRMSKAPARRGSASMYGDGVPGVAGKKTPQMRVCGSSA